MKIYAVIVAGGSGKRMESEIPKQFIELAGKPVLMHTIERFKSYRNDIEIITVLPEDELRNWVDLQKKHSFNVQQTLVKGGSSRFHSVKKGLEFVEEPGLVAIHDGVRPFVSLDTIKRCFDTAVKFGNAIPVIAPADTVRSISGKENRPMNRLNIRMVQTPQVFDAASIKQAYNCEYSPELTDDATVLERAGAKINLVEGNTENIKITNPVDMIIANALLFRMG